MKSTPSHFRLHTYAIFFLACLFSRNSFAQPFITSFSPVSGPVGTMVTIKGSNFSTVPEDNVVYFGAVKAPVVDASDTLLTVKVPRGATYQPLSVTANYLTAYSEKPFITTFPAGGSNFNSQSFGRPASFESGSDPRRIVAADIDGDGMPDYVFTNIPTSGPVDSFSIVRNTSVPGAISFGPKVSFETTRYIQDVCVGDIDGDGKLDLIVLNNMGHTISAYKNTSTTGSISFAPKVDIFLTYQYSQVVVRDLNGDGRADIITSQSFSNVISVIQNMSYNSSIAFAPGVDFIVQIVPHTITVGDLNKDGKPELIYSDKSYKLNIMKNQSSSTTISFVETNSYSVGSQNIEIGDLDGDDMPDLALVAYVNYDQENVTVLRNTGNSGNISFVSEGNYAVGGYARISIADLDGDGRPDLVTGGPLDNLISILKNTSTTGSTSFNTKISFHAPTNGNLFDVAITDVDGDGRPDIGVANRALNSFSVLRNEIGENAQLCPAGNTTLTSNFIGSSYHWQVNTGNGFENISDNNNYNGTNSRTLQLNTIPSSWYGYQYKCLVDGNSSNLFVIKFVNNWIGAGSTTWEDPANWSCGVIPDANTDVVISSGTVVLNSNASCRSLKVNTSASFNVSAGYTLTVTK